MYAHGSPNYITSQQLLALDVGRILTFSSHQRNENKLSKEDVQ